MRGVIGTVEGELGANVGVEFSGFGVVEGVRGLTIVDEGFCDIGDGGLNRSYHDLLCHWRGW